MPYKITIIGTTFALFHILIVAPFVPFINIFPVALAALSMSSMALALVLAARWPMIDWVLGGPDKSYKAHRWLGFFALSGALGHWVLAVPSGTAILPILSESGEDIGNLALAGLIIMTAMALVRVVPYHLWKRSHFLMGPIFLFSVYHSFFVPSPLAVGSPPWILMAIVSVCGGAAWGQTLLRKRKPMRFVKVEDITPFDGGLDITLRADTTLPSFRPGQFAHMAKDGTRTEAHPFTIAGADATSRRFMIRSAGDWTDEFVRTVKQGDKFRLSHSAGRFLPKIHKKRNEQLWVAGGVGIAPFLAALEQMEPDCGRSVTLIYCIRSHASSAAMDDVKEFAGRLPQLDLIICNAENGDRLTPTSLTHIMRNRPMTTEAYLCGPEPLKAMVKGTWETIGMNGPIHEEQFDFRSAYTLSELKSIVRPSVYWALNWVSKKKGIAHAATGS